MEDCEATTDPQGQSPPIDADDKRKFQWKPLEYDEALQAEGLMGLEVLQDDEVVELIKKPKKAKKETKKKDAVKQELEAEDRQQDVEATDDQVEEATKSWDHLLFQDWKIPVQVRRNMYRAGMVSPTVIQKLVLKPALLGSNIVASAETGSGKTLAFSLPVIMSLLKQGPVEPDKRVVLCLTILPTRELALQVKDTIVMLLKETHMKAFSLIGGISMQKQERIIKNKPEIIVATPGRLWDAINKFDITFKLQYLILDEADMLVVEHAFKELKSIVAKVKTNSTQALIFSATILNRKRDLNELFKLLKLHNPTVCAASHKGDLVVSYEEFLKNKSFQIKETEEAANTTLPASLKFNLIKCLDADKELKLVSYLMQHYSNVKKGRTVLFVNSISYAYRLEPLLSLILWKDKHELRIAKSHCMTLDKESNVDYITSIHSKLKQKQRLKRLEQFTKHGKSILICTDLASRGLDLPDVDTVIHFQPPRGANLFIHRSGRTARLSAEGVAVCICLSSEMEKWEELFKAINRSINEVEEIMECIPQKQYQQYKKLMALANAIESKEHQLSKETKTESWLQTAAKQADIELSDEDMDEEHSMSRLKAYRSLKSGKRALLNLRSSVTS